MLGQSHHGWVAVSPSVVSAGVNRLSQKDRFDGCIAGLMDVDFDFVIGEFGTKGFNS